MGGAVLAAMLGVVRGGGVHGRDYDYGYDYDYDHDHVHVHEGGDGGAHLRDGGERAGACAGGAARGSDCGGFGGVSAGQPARLRRSG